MKKTSPQYYEEAFASQAPSVVLITTPTCGPCRASKPNYLEVLGELVGKVDLYILDASEDLDFFRAKGIRSVPFSLFIKDGKIAGEHSGIITKTNLKNLINQLLLNLAQE